VNGEQSVVSGRRLQTLQKTRMAEGDMTISGRSFAQRRLARIVLTDTDVLMPRMHDAEERPDNPVHLLLPWRSDVGIKAIPISARPLQPLKAR